MYDIILFIFLMSEPSLWYCMYALRVYGIHTVMSPALHLLRGVVNLKKHIFYGRALFATIVCTV